MTDLVFPILGEERGWGGGELGFAKPTVILTNSSQNLYENKKQIDQGVGQSMKCLFSHSFVLSVNAP